MQFKKYSHVERLGTDEVLGIEDGVCHVFPKLDGTNASVWLGDHGEICAGSRNRQLSSDYDNHGFYSWASQDETLGNFLRLNPNTRLYGEWLVPHTIKSYNSDAWSKFYIFDVSENDVLVHFDNYSAGLTYCRFNVIEPIFVGDIRETDLNELTNNRYLIDPKTDSIGEGIVIKNYNFVNKYGRQCWAKRVNVHFDNRATFPRPQADLIECRIANKYVDEHLVLKERAKIETAVGGWKMDMMPRLLNSVYHSMITEDSWQMLKDFKNPTVNFNQLQREVYKIVSQMSKNF